MFDESEWYELPMDFTPLREELSNSYYKREDLMQNFSLPSITETMEELGEELSDIVFCQCHEELQEELGLSPLDDPDLPLWLSPSDLLIGKIRLKPPYTSRGIQALTHEGILELGWEIEKRFIDQLENEKRQALEEKEALLLKLFELREARLIEQIRKEEQSKRMEEIEKIIREFEWKIIEILQSVDILIDKHFVELDEQEEYWRQKLKNTVDSVTIRITKHFLERLKRQEEILLAIFQHELQQLKEKKRRLLLAEQKQCQQKLKQLRRSLECKNLANLMFVLCKERRKCYLEKKLIEDNYKSRLFELESKPDPHLDEIRRLKIRNREYQRKLQAREHVLMAVLCQFQKFINFALRASPTQAEFLLSVGRILQEFMQEPKVYDETESVKLELGEEVEEEEVEIQSIQRLEDKLSETSSGKEEDEQSEELPVFTFKDKLYVRQECRDCLLAREKTQKMHWCEGIEELLKVFRQVVEADQTQEDNDTNRSEIEEKEKEVREFNESVQYVPKLSCEKISKQSSVGRMQLLEQKAMSNSSNVHFKSINEVESTVSRKSTLKATSYTSTQVNYAAIGQVERSKTLLAVQDSLEITALVRQETSKESAKEEKRSNELLGGRKSSNSDRKSLLSATKRRGSKEMDKKPSPTAPRSDVKLLKTRDSIILRKATLEAQEAALEIEKFRESIGIAESHAKPQSKIIHHTDSIEIIKSTLSLMHSEQKERSASIVTADGKSTVAFEAKPNRLKISGDKYAKEHLLHENEFTRQRIRSFVGLIKDNTSLLHLFTSCMR